MSNADMPAMPSSADSCSIDAITNSSVTIEDMALWNRGLTKREYFAAHAPDMPYWFNSRHPELNQMARMVAWRYAYADAMLAEGK
jgi:hypothetical protein